MIEVCPVACILLMLTFYGSIIKLATDGCMVWLECPHYSREFRFGISQLGSLPSQATVHDKGNCVVFLDSVARYMCDEVNGALCINSCELNITVGWNRAIFIWAFSMLMDRLPSDGFQCDNFNDLDLTLKLEYYGDRNM